MFGFRWLIECIPVVIIMALMAWSYYLYVKVLCDNLVESGEIAKKTCYLIVYHGFLIMMLWSYFKTMCTKMATVPIRYRLPIEFYEIVKYNDLHKIKNDILLVYSYKQDLIILTRNELGNVRFCHRCKHIKPDRAHHCISCGRCVLKMDHHCAWIHNCVGFTNYKAYILLLCYGGLYCAYYCATTLEFFMDVVHKDKKTADDIQIIIACILTAIIGSFVFAFLGFHLAILVKNQTSIETLRAPIFRENNGYLTYDIGGSRNVREVFGDHCFMYFIPEGGGKGDGIHFPVRLIF